MIRCFVLLPPMPIVFSSMLGVTVWFTGLPSSGKTTLSKNVRAELLDAGPRVVSLDGDEVRLRLSKGLGFSREDRRENLRRIGYMAEIVSYCGGVALVSAISPYRNVREECRRESARFVEVFVDCPLKECIRRDVKGMYKKVLSGELEHFTGVSDPCEPPLAPGITVKTSEQTVAESVAVIMSRLSDLGYLGGDNATTAR